MANLRAAPELTELLADLFRQVSALVIVETDLARAELAESSSRAVGGLVKLAAGAVLLLFGVPFLLSAIVAFLVRLGVPVDVSYLIVAAVTIGVGIIILRSGVKALKPANLAPRRTMAQISSFMRGL